MAGSVEKLIMMDASHDMIKLCKDDTGAHDQDIETSFIVGDEEFLPIKERCSYSLFHFQLCATTLANALSFQFLNLWDEVQ